MNLVNAKLDDMELLTYVGINVKQPPNGLTKAKGDGVTDDTNAIQTILDYVGLNGGGKVLIPNGIYMINAISTTTVTGGIKVNYDNVEIVLSPNATLKVIPNSSPRYDLISFQSIKNGKISGGRLEGDRITHNYSAKSTHEFGNAILINSAEYITIENMLITNFTGDSIAVFGSNSSGIYLPSRYINILNNTLDMARRNNISVIVATDVFISGNNILNAGVNDGFNNGTDPKAGIDIEGGSCPSRIIITNNIFKNNIGGSLVIFNGNDVVVNGNVSDNFFAYQNATNLIISNNELKNYNPTTHSGIEQTTTGGGASKSGTMLAIGSKYKITNRTTLDYTTVGALNNNVGTVFVVTKALPLLKGDIATRITENIFITDNEIIGFKGGITGNTGSTINVVVKGNYLQGQTSVGIHAYTGFTVIGNTLVDQAIGIRAIGTNINIKGNSIDKVTNRGIYCTDATSTGIIQGNSIRNTNTLNSAIDIADCKWNVIENIIECGSTYTTGYAISCGGIGTSIANNVINGGKLTGGAIRLSNKASVIGNKIIAVDAPCGIYSTTTNASSSIISQNYIELISNTRNRYGIFFSGGGTGVKIISNEIHNNVLALTNSINTSANTASSITRNIVTSGTILSNGSDTLLENLLT